MGFNNGIELGIQLYNFFHYVEDFAFPPQNQKRNKKEDE